MSIDWCDDVLDSREIVERLAELAEAEDAGELDECEPAELALLRRVDAEGRDYCEDWEYGVTLVRDSYFQDYAMELADDLGMLPKEHTWPISCIDWEQAARELRMDYTSIEAGGVTWWLP